VYKTQVKIENLYCLLKKNPKPANKLKHLILG